MSSNSNFTEWTQEEKDQFAQKRMAEMKLKNEMLKRRHAEVEFDRISAEQRNSAVTNASKAIKKDTNCSKNESYGVQNKVEYQREWDRGKSDKEYLPEHHFPVKSMRTGHRFKAVMDRRDSKDSFFRNKSSNSYRYGNNTSDNWMKPKRGFRYKQYENQHSISHHYKSPEKRRGFGHRSYESYRKPNAYSEEKYKKFDFNKAYPKKKFSRRAHSQFTKDPVDNGAGMKLSYIRLHSMFGNDEASTYENQLSRTEKWVKSVSGIQFDRIKGFKSKRSPQSISSSKNEHVRKQRRFDRGFRDEDTNKFPKFKQQNDSNPEAGSWNNSAVGNKNFRNERSVKNTSNFIKANALNAGNDDNWGSVIKETPGDDGLWGSAEQSDIKLKLSDDETTITKSEDKTSGRKRCVSSDKRNEKELSGKVEHIRHFDKFESEKNANEESLKNSSSSEGMWWNVMKKNYENQEMDDNRDLF